LEEAKKTGTAGGGVCRPPVRPALEKGGFCPRYGAKGGKPDKSVLGKREKAGGGDKIKVSSAARSGETFEGPVKLRKGNKKGVLKIQRNRRGKNRGRTFKMIEVGGEAGNTRKVRWLVRATH